MFSYLVGEVFRDCQLAKWLLLVVQAHQDLLWFA